jgi:hypothetical protein
MTTTRPVSGLHKLTAQARWCQLFYGAMLRAGRGPRVGEVVVRAAAGYPPELVAELVSCSLDEDSPLVQMVNFRSRIVAYGEPVRRFFVKEYPHLNAWHGLERVLRCARVDRAWAAAQVLPKLGFLTPPPVGMVVRPQQGRGTIAYGITEMIEEALPFHRRLLPLEGEARQARLREYVEQMRRWHDVSVYLHDLLPNVLTKQRADEWDYYLTDLDQLHPYRRLTRKRLLHQFYHLARWTGPLSEEEQRMVVQTFAGEITGALARDLFRVLAETLPSPSLGRNKPP